MKNYYNVPDEVFQDLETCIKEEKEFYGYVYPIFGVLLNTNELILKYIVTSNKEIEPLEVLTNKGIEAYAYGTNHSGDWANFYYFELGDETVDAETKREYFIQKYERDGVIKISA